MKNIVVCCDGTGNEVREGAQSNVLELYQRLDKSSPRMQVVYYDPGLGTLPAPGVQTRTFKFVTRVLGLAFAYGLPGNIKRAYHFLMHNYEEGDRIFLFGFSRGAYTVRALAGMIYMCGLLDPRCDNLVDYALQVHGTREGNRWKVAARFRKYFPRQWARERGDRRIHFVGVWDTVKSVGLFRRSLVLPYTRDMKAVAHGRHAVSLDERRTKYRPNLWEPEHGDEVSPGTGLPRFQQVWFPGVHSDVGGGYESTGLSDVALDWMLREAEAHGVHLAKGIRARPLRPDPLGALHDPLRPIWWILGWRDRLVPPDALVHDSVGVRRRALPDYDRRCARLLSQSVRYVATRGPARPGALEPGS